MSSVTVQQATTGPSTSNANSSAQATTTTSSTALLQTPVMRASSEVAERIGIGVGIMVGIILIVILYWRWRRTKIVDTTSGRLQSELDVLPSLETSEATLQGPKRNRDATELPGGRVV